MSDLFSHAASKPAPPEPAAPVGNMPEQTVSELSRALKRTVETAFDRVRVRGELSQPKTHSSGHIYLRIKDDDAVLDAVIWKGVAGKLPLRPVDGLEVIVTGRLTTYPQRSNYQLVIDGMEMAGEGALLKILEDRKQRLLAEGLFDDSRKRPLPFLPNVIGVITSPTGAVIRDILHRLQDRFPRHVLVWPVAVQGETAPQQIITALKGFVVLSERGEIPRPDLIIVARGGGSLEDLMAFNDESLVRAVAHCPIPVISAVGHETDTTLIDFAADKRAPTPTAAAEMAVPVRADLQIKLAGQHTRLLAAIQRGLTERQRHLEGLQRGLPHPERLLETITQRLDYLGERHANSLRRGLEQRRETLTHLRLRLRPPDARLLQASQSLQQIHQRLTTSLSRRLEREQDNLTRLGELLHSVSYHAVLQRGFVMVRDDMGNALLDGAGLASGQSVQLHFRDAVKPAQIK